MFDEIKRLFHKNTSVQKALLVSLASFLILLWIGPIIGKAYTLYLANNSEKILKDAIAIDAENLFVQGNKIAEIDLLKKYTEEGDSYRILGTINQEKEKLGNLIDYIGVMDKDGFVISRSQISKGLGDNYFIATAMGRQLAKNIATSSIEVRGVDNTELIITTGRPIMDNGYRRGALVASRILGDKYSAEIREKLPFGAEVIFYTKEYGICGMSFENQSERKTIQSYINPDSDFIRKGKTGDSFSLHYGRSYLIKNIEFPGLESSSGGAILLVPNYASRPDIQFLMILLTLLIFVVLIILVHRNTPKEDRGKTYYSAVIAAFIFLCAIVFITNTAYFIDYVRSKKTPTVLYNSTMRLSPDFGTFNSKVESKVSILVDTGEESVNAFDVGINFDPDMVEIIDISIENSICSQLIEKSIDNDAGKIRTTCIVFNPGYTGKSGNIADIIFRIKKHGQFGFVFTDDTEVLANDGLGTSVLRTTLSGSYHGEDQAGFEALREGGVGDSSLTSLDVYSPTHPNSERWYRLKEAEFLWSNPKQKTFAYSFNQFPFDIPSTSSTTMGHEIFEKITKSGIYYFHLAEVIDGAVGPAEHYKVMIDIDGPRDVIVRSSATEVEAGDIVHFMFSATSSNSGLQRTFYVNIGGGSELFYPVGRETYMPMLDPLGAGVQKITIRVFDMAGNYIDRTIEIKVKGSPIRNVINRIFNSI